MLQCQRSLQWLTLAVQSHVTNQRLLVPSLGAQTAGRRFLRDDSEVPRPRPDRSPVKFKVSDTGYTWNYHDDADRLPRMKKSMHSVRGSKYEPPVDEFDEKEALFGANDYVDLLGGDANRVHPAQLQYHTPPWLQAFPGKHRANELVRLIHYRNLYKTKLQRNSPRRWHELVKHIGFLLKYHNYRKSDEMHPERELGLWEQEPDYYYKDKTKRTYLAYNGLTPAWEVDIPKSRRKM